MKTCVECKGVMDEHDSHTPEGIKYRYFKCRSCGEEIVDRKQLHELAKKYSQLKRFHAKLSNWGTSLGLRIPKELAKRYNFTDDKEVTLIPEKEGLKILPVFD